MKKYTKAIFLMITAALFFSLTSASVKVASKLPISQIIFVRNLISMFVAGITIYIQKGSFTGKNRKLLTLRSILGLLGLATYFYSIEYLPLGDAVSLNKLSPFFTILIASVFLHETIYFLQIPALLLALVGALFISRPQFEGTLFPAFIGILGSFFAGSAYACVRKLRTSDHPQTIVFYFSTLSTLCTLPFFNSFIMPNPKELLALLGVGIFASVAQFSMTYAYRYGNASSLSIYDYSQILFSILIGVVIGQGFPDLISSLGIILILLGAIFNYFVLQSKNSIK